MTNNLVSIVIPVFNVENYTENCLNSIINQSYKNIEIIIIDNFSEDNSLSIIKKFKDPRIKLIANSSNLGVSSARNIGVDNAIGEYITFIDSDDWVDTNYVEMLLHNIYNVDLVIADFIYYSEKKQKKLSKPSLNEYFLSQHSKIFSKQDLINNFNKATVFVWGKLYKLSIIKGNNIRFVGKIAEDTLFNIEYYININSSIKIIEDKLYYYRLGRKNSITSNIQEHNQNILEAFDRLKKLLEVSNNFNNAKKAYYCYVLNNLQMFSRKKANLDIAFFKQASLKLRKIPKEMIIDKKMSLLRKSWFRYYLLNKILSFSYFIVLIRKYIR
jgi:glycosyltransferase involved in cell wall biosynthesis